MRCADLLEDPDIVATLAAADGVVLVHTDIDPATLDALRRAAAHIHVFAQTDVEPMRALLHAHLTARRVLVLSGDPGDGPAMELTELCSTAGARFLVVAER